MDKVLNLEAPILGGVCYVCGEKAVQRLMIGWAEGNVGQRTGLSFCDKCLANVHSLISCYIMRDTKP